MRILDLDFRRTQRQRKWPGLILLLAGLGGAVAIGDQYSRLSDELAQAQASVRQSGSAARRQTAALVAGGDQQKLAVEVKRASEVALQLKLPWKELFASVEAANTPNVALLSIESETGKRQIKLAGEAKDLDFLLDYIRALAAQPRLANVYLQSHHLQQQDPEHPVRFVLGADWVSGQ